MGFLPLNAKAKGMPLKNGSFLKGLSARFDFFEPGCYQI
jgi:hypothetical protein